MKHEEIMEKLKLLVGESLKYEKIEGDPEDAPPAYTFVINDDKIILGPNLATFFLQNVDIDKLKEERGF